MSFEIEWGFYEKNQSGYFILGVSPDEQIKNVKTYFN